MPPLHSILILARCIVFKDVQPIQIYKVILKAVGTQRWSRMTWDGNSHPSIKFFHFYAVLLHLAIKYNNRRKTTSCELWICVRMIPYRLNLYSKSMLRAIEMKIPALALFFFVCLFLVGFFLGGEGVAFRAALSAYGGSQARGQIGATATDLHHHHSNTRSEPCLQPTPQFTATMDPQPTEQGRGRTHNRIAPSPFISTAPWWELRLGFEDSSLYWPQFHHS